MEMIQIPSKTIEEEFFLIDNENDLLYMINQLLGGQAEEILKMYINNYLSEIECYEFDNDELTTENNRLNDILFQQKENNEFIKLIPKSCGDYYVFERR